MARGETSPCFQCVQKKQCATFTCTDPDAGVEAPCGRLADGDEYTDATCGLDDAIFAAQQALLAGEASAQTDAALGALLPILLIALGAAVLVGAILAAVIVWANILKKRNRALEGVALGRGVTAGTKVKLNSAIVVGKALDGPPEEGHGSDDPFKNMAGAAKVNMNPLAMTSPMMAKSAHIDDMVDGDDGFGDSADDTIMGGFNPLAAGKNPNRRSIRG